MNNTRNFVISILALLVTTGALIGLTLFSFANFNYRGSGLDWIYPTSGFLMLGLIGSVAAVFANGSKVIAQRKRIKQIKRASDSARP